jgi:gentisate 1,2-dioxygenase
MTGQVEVESALAGFYRDVEGEHLAPLWPIARDLMSHTPQPRTLPWLWRGAEMQRLAERSGELITIERGGDRRVLSLANPGLGGLPFASSTLWGAIQYLNPGEHAPAHRHSPAAVRFVMQGTGVYTTVDGDACDMAPGDLILTPSGTWHDHNSVGDVSMVWFDGLDLPIAGALDAIFFEEYPSASLQPVKSRNRSEREYAGRGLLPADRVGVATTHSPRLAYRWADTDAALRALVQERGGPMATLEFCDPVTGRPALPTMGCQMHRLAVGERTPSTRRTGSSVFVVHSGAGVTVIDGMRYPWKVGDIFVTPSWSLVDHEAYGPSDLFSITDAPVLRALGLYREESHDRHQEVAGTFSAQLPA